MPYPRSKVKRICAWCGAEFWVMPSIIKRGDGRYCSRSCVTRAINKNRTYSREKKAPYLESFCLECGKKLYLREKQIQKGQGKFCSRSCMAKWRWKQGQLSNSRGSGWLTVYCQQCGKEFRVTNYDASTGQGKFCSRSCLAKWRQLHDPSFGVLPLPDGSWGRLNDYVRPDGTRVRFRSMLERAFAEGLEQIGEEWLYEPKTFALDHDKWRRYTPDFYLPRYEQWVEVKGWMRDEKPLVFCNQYPEVKLTILVGKEEVARFLAGLAGRGRWLKV